MVVGLGNPGERYARTRHNVGFMVAEELLRRGRSGNDRMQDSALVGPIVLAGCEAIVVRPQTFMNLSGTAVAAVARRRGIEASEMLIVYDDADLPLGSIRVRPGGSPAGHNGVTSIVESMGTRDIARIRLGIDKDGRDLARRVLSPFAKAEMPVVEEMIDRAADAVEVIAEKGIPHAMNTYNRRESPSA